MTTARDMNRFYVHYWFPTTLARPPFEDSDAIKVNIGARGTVVEIQAWVSRTPGWQDRQSEFDHALAGALTKLKHLGMKRTQLEQLGGQLELRIVLIPDQGVAGLVLPSRSLREWVAFGADLYLESWADTNATTQSVLHGPGAI